MKIKRIIVKGYKSIEDQTVDLKPINIIIGGNGAGKTNLISSLELLRNIYDKNLQRFVIANMGAEGLLHWGKKVTDKILIETEFENDGFSNRYGVELAESQDTLFIQSAYTSFFRDGQWRKQLCDSSVNEATIKDDRTGQAYYVGPMLSRFDVYHFHDTSPKSPIKGVKDINDNISLRRDGSNIAPFLYYLKMKHTPCYNLIEKTVALAIPSFKCFVLEPDRLNPMAIRLRWRQNEGGDMLFNDWQFSDGSLRFICLATLLLQPNPPETIIIDEPELGLHPQAINIVASLIKQVSANSQVIVSTQSVGLIDNFDAEDIIVANHNGKETVFVRHSNEDLRQWLDEYSLGEIWEMNIIGGQPL